MADTVEPLPRHAQDSPPFGWLDVACALIELAAFLVGAVAIDEPGNQDSLPLLLAFGVPLAACQLVVRRYPLPVLLLSVTIVGAYHLVGGDPVGMIWPMLLPYAVAVRYGNLWPVIAIVVLVTGSSVAWRIMVEGELVRSVGLGEALGLVTIGLAIAVGEAAWQRARYIASTQARIRQVTAAARTEAERQIARQRLAVAADLHDVAGHSLVTIGLQLQIAAETVDSDPVATRKAIETALRAHGQALRDTTATVRVLREEGHVPMAIADEDPLNIEGLRSIASMAGIALDANVRVPPRLASDRIFAIARILQESLTNTIRHANATRGTLTVREDDAGVALEFEDDGRTSPEPLADGFGITGMRERAAHLGGRLDVVRHDGGGVRISAWIPIEGVSS